MTSLRAWLQNDRASEALCEGQNFVWSDGSAVDYDNWAAGEPNSWSSGAAQCDQEVGAGEDCTEAWGGGESWADSSCGGTKAYVCGNAACAAAGTPHNHFPSRTVTNTTTTVRTGDSAAGPPSPSGPPPTSDETDSGQVFTFYATPATWYDAEDNCAREHPGGHLATVTSAAEQRQMEHLFNTAGADTAWIGLVSATAATSFVRCKLEHALC